MTTLQSVDLQSVDQKLFYFASIFIKTEVGVFHEVFHSGVVEPPSIIFQGLGKVPVVQSYHGLYPCELQGVNQPLVILHSPGIYHFISSQWEDS